MPPGQPTPPPVEHELEQALPAEPATAAHREVRKTVSVLSCDVVASGAQLDPESLRRMSARGFEAVLPSLERHGASVERSLGGAVTAIFGIPAVHEDDALRAVSAAVEMRDRLVGLRDELEGQWGAWLELRVGIGTGEILAGRDGDQQYATGAPVAAALRLQQIAETGAVLVDQRTHRLVEHAVECEAADEHVRIVRPASERPSPRAPLRLADGRSRARTATSR